MRTARLFLGSALLTLAFVAGAAGQDTTDTDYKAKALRLNKEATAEESANAKLKELLKDKPGTTQLVKAAADVLKAAKEGEKPFRFYAALVVAMAAENVKDHDAADLFLNFCTDNAINDLQSGKLIVLAAEKQLDFLWARKKFDKVNDLCDRLLALEGDKTLSEAKFFFMEKQIQATAKQGEYDKALEKADRLVKAFDGEWYFLQIRGWVQREAGKMDDAIKTYKEVVAAIEGNENMKKDVRDRYARNTKYLLSGLYLDNNQFDESVKILEDLVKGDPENPTFYNDLGFLLADHDTRIDEAEKMIRKAVELDLAAKKKALEKKLIDEEAAKKVTPAYVDSLGWVLYKNKKYEEAMKYLLEAAKDEEEGGHIEIWDHVGDCYLALGKKKEALETFQKALKMEDVTKKDSERRKKVTEKIKKLKAEVK